tara:strand:+ start:64 stop:492 length:429 start_codon:yes stop_codon:yes gene_type:complete
MPRGRGTYGRKRGRPPKTKKKGLLKKMYDKLYGKTPLTAKKGGMAKSSAQTSVIKGASVGGSREGSVIKGPASKGSREGSVIKAKDGKWIQKAIKKPGSLRRALGVKKGKDIPAKKLTTAAKKKGKIGQRARLAQTLKGFKR